MKIKFIFSTISLILVLLSSYFSNTNNRQDTFNTPESLGFNSKVFSKLINYVKVNDINVNSIYIQRKNQVVLNASFFPQMDNDLHDVASISKSITSLLIGIAIDEGHIKSVNQPIIEFFPNKKSLFNSDIKRTLTVKQLLTMSSGICSSFNQGEQTREVLKINEEPLKFILNNLQSDSSKFVYCSTGVQLLSIIITKSTNKTLEQYAVEKLFKPLKIKAFKFAKDKSGFTNASGDIFLKSDDLAKIGQLVLNKGIWNGDKVISEKWIQESTTSKIRLNNEESYGYLWWLRNDLDGLIEAQGRGGQRLIILPKKEIVVVMFGTGFNSGKIGKFIVEALKSDNKINNNLNSNDELKKNLISIKTDYRNSSFSKKIVKDFNDKRFYFQKNQLGLVSFSINQKNETKTTFQLDVKDKITDKVDSRRIPLGMLGKYLRSYETRFKTPLAAKANWIDNRTILIDYNEFSNTHKYKIKIQFIENRAVFKIQETEGEVLELEANLKNKS